MPETVDTHQHLWPEAYAAALARRTRPPRIARVDGVPTLLLAGEPPWAVDPLYLDVEARRALCADDGVDRVLLVPCTPPGVESLPPDEAWELLDAYHAGVGELGPPFGWWAGSSLLDPDPARLAERLDEGAVGLALPANALADAQGWHRCGPLLRCAERRGAPVFVHPGPAPWRPVATAVPGDPPWWPALTSYVEGMNAAWHGHAAHGHAAHPRLRLCFAMLAGLAPLHEERLIVRGGSPLPADGVFLETSSYGVRALDAVARVLGVDVLVHGSDRPVAPPGPDLGPAAAHAARVVNPARLLQPQEVIA